MGKGSNPRNNHSAEWFANYDDIDWKSSPRIAELNEEQLDCYHVDQEELQHQGANLTICGEKDFMEAIKKDIK